MAVLVKIAIDKKECALAHSRAEAQSEHSIITN